MSNTMDKVLFVRIPNALNRMINMAVKNKKKASPGTSVSKADVVRELLYGALTPKKKKK